LLAGYVAVAGSVWKRGDSYCLGSELMYSKALSFKEFNKSNSSRM
jgi:hypothetical protein